MYPARFEYAAPSSLDEALSLLEQHGDDAKLLAGGQSLIPLLKIRFAAPSLLIDLNRIADLSAVEAKNGGLRIGALARHNQLADSETIKGACPIMAAAAPLIADPLVRNLGTIGGSLAHADPAGDWGAVMLALGAEVVARSASGERVIPIGEFFKGTFTTDLKPNEIITEIRVPKPAGKKAGGTYLKQERKVGDFATVAVAVQLEMDGKKIGRAGIGLTAVGPQNIQAKEAEASLAGTKGKDKDFDEAARLAAEAARPATDVRGSADYKKDLVRVFVRRGLERALEIARAA